MSKFVLDDETDCLDAAARNLHDLIDVICGLQFESSNEIDRGGQPSMDCPRHVSRRLRWNRSRRKKAEGFKVSNIPSRFLKPDLAELEKLDMQSLEGHQFKAVYDALSLAILGLSGILEQPRCKIGGRANGAGNYVSTLQEFMHAERTRLIDALNQNTPKTAFDAHVRMHLLVQYEAECQELGANELAGFVLSCRTEPVEKSNNGENG